MLPTFETADSASAGPTATATAIVADGVVTQLALTNVGQGYTQIPTVTFSGGGGFGASALAAVTDGAVSSLKLLSGGRGYTAAPTVAIDLEGGAALLTYGMLSNPDPLQVPQSEQDTATLTLNVSNSGTSIVTCSAITVTLPGPSQNAQDLTDSFTGIGVVVPVGTDEKPLWSSSQDGGTFTLSPLTEVASQIAGAGLFFIFDNILVNESVGACSVTINETAASNGQPRGTRTAPAIALQKWPPLFSISGPTATPLEVLYNGSTTLAWSVTGQGITSELLYNPDGNGQIKKPVANVGTLPVPNLTNPNGVVFTLQATLPVPGQSEPLTSQSQVTVGVIPNPTVTFSIAPDPVAPGEPVTFTLNWDAVDVTSFQITANDGPHGSSYALPVPIAIPGSYQVAPKALTVDYTFQVLSTAETLTEGE